MKKIILMSLMTSASLLIVGCANTPEPPKQPYVIINTKNNKPYWYDEANCPKQVNTEIDGVYVCTDINGTKTGITMTPMSDDEYTRHLQNEALKAQIAASKAQESRNSISGAEAIGYGLNQFANGMNSAKRQTNCVTSYIGTRAYTNCY